MKPSTLRRAAMLLPPAALFFLMPGLAFAQDAPPETTQISFELTSLWIMLSAILVIFMQLGFMFLEVGFARGKNVGTIVAKIAVNFSVAAVVYWAIGYGIAYGEDGNAVFGLGSFFFSATAGAPEAYSIEGYTDFIFQFAFAAVSLAIVWGSTLERIKFWVYPIFGVVFVAIIYPMMSHWVWAGTLTPLGRGVQDFAGSSVVHLTGATAALAALLILGPRRGKYGPDGKPRPIPGHNMPLFGLAVFILWVGWFGFNAGSTLSAAGADFGRVAVVTNLGAAGGVLGAMIMSVIMVKSLDVGMIGNGAIAGLVAITAPSGYVMPAPAILIGLVAGIIVVPSIIAIDKKLDDPVGVISVHGIAGIWGTLSCGLFTAGSLAESVGVGDPGLFAGGGVGQLLTQAIAVGATFGTVFILSFVVFFLIDKTIGMRVSAEEEEAGLDISEHGMYGYPEQFIPQAELAGYGLQANLTRPSAVSATSKTQEV